MAKQRKRFTKHCLQSQYFIKTNNPNFLSRLTGVKVVSCTQDWLESKRKEIFTERSHA